MKKKLLLSIAAVSFFIGCGGVSAGGDNSSDTQTGTFVDAPVQGLEYETTSGIKGVTDKDGHFEYKMGDKIIFRLGNTILGFAILTDFNKVLSPYDITLNDNEAKDVAYILQNLDMDGNLNNGIQLPPQSALEHVIGYDDGQYNADIEEIKNELSIIKNNLKQIVENANFVDIDENQAKLNLDNYLVDLENQKYEAETEENSNNDNGMYDTNANGASVKVEIEDNGEYINIYPKSIGGWSYYYLGYTSPNDMVNEGEYNDNPIEAVSSHYNATLGCGKISEDNTSITYSCATTIEYPNGTSLAGDVSDIGDNTLVISKNQPVYLYEKGLFSTNGYAVGEFNYKDNKVVYTPYEKAKKINFANNSLINSNEYGGLW
jgi:hypothetical protein